MGRTVSRFTDGVVLAAPRDEAVELDLAGPVVRGGRTRVGSVMNVLVLDGSFSEPSLDVVSPLAEVVELVRRGPDATFLASLWLHAAAIMLIATAAHRHPRTEPNVQANHRLWARKRSPLWSDLFRRATLTPTFVAGR
jgi:hypothetical protein